MPTDQEYLETAGLNESGEALSSQPQAAPATTETPQTAQEMFELSGNKYPVTTEFSFIQDGKTEKVPYNSLVNGYRRASHLQQKWESDYKPKITEWEAQKPQFEQYKGFYDKYNALQTWSEQNPEDWKRLEEIWKNKDQHLLASQANAQGPNGQVNPHLDPIIKKLTDLENKFNTKFEPFVKSVETREKEEAEQKDVDSVKNEIVGFQKEFPEIDLNEKDPDGIPLWAKITQWGTSKGYIEYAPAAMMYLKPRIAEIYALRARNEVMKSAKSDHAQGIVKRSATPFQASQSSQQPQNIRKLSYAELTEKAKSDLQSASGS